MVSCLGCGCFLVILYRYLCFFCLLYVVNHGYLFGAQLFPCYFVPFPVSFFFVFVPCRLTGILCIMQFCQCYFWMVSACSHVILCLLVLWSAILRHIMACNAVVSMLVLGRLFSRYVIFVLLYIVIGFLLCSRGFVSGARLFPGY